MSAYWLNKQQLAEFQSMSNTLSSLKQCPWKAENKQRLREQYWESWHLQQCGVSK